MLANNRALNVSLEELQKCQSRENMLAAIDDPNGLTRIFDAKEFDGNGSLYSDTANSCIEAGGIVSIHSVEISCVITVGATSIPTNWQMRNTLECWVGQTDGVVCDPEIQRRAAEEKLRETFRVQIALLR
jgi:hypothetical protein